MTPPPRALALLPMASLVSLSSLAWLDARAEAWQVDTRWRAGAEAEHTGGDTRQTARVGTDLTAGRASETAATRLEATLDLLGGDAGSRGRSEGRVGLSQSLEAPRDTFSAALDLRADSTADAPIGSSDVLLGRGDRRQRGASLGWTHRFTERWSAQLGVALGSTNYDASIVGASDYRTRSVSTALVHAWSETAQLSLSLARSALRSDGLDSETTSDSLGLTWTTASADRTRMAASVGGYRAVRRTGFTVRVCPLPQQYCDAGVVDPVVVRRTAALAARGGSYGLRLDERLDERTTLALRLSRELQTGGAGVQRSDLGSLSLEHAWTPHRTLGLAAGFNRAATLVAGEAGQTLRSVAFTLDQALSADSRLRIGADLRRLSGSADGTTTRFSISYESNGPSQRH